MVCRDYALWCMSCKFKKLYKISIVSIPKKLFKAAFARVEPTLCLNVSFFKMITNKSTNQNQLITKFHCKTEAINSIFNEFVDGCSFNETRDWVKIPDSPFPQKPEYLNKNSYKSNFWHRSSHRDLYSENDTSIFPWNQHKFSLFMSKVESSIWFELSIKSS